MANDHVCTRQFSSFRRSYTFFDMELSIGIAFLVLVLGTGTLVLISFACLTIPFQIRKLYQFGNGAFVCHRDKVA